MRNPLPVSSVIIFSVLLIACRNGTPASQSIADTADPIIITTDAFSFVLHEGVQRGQAAEIGDSLSANASRIMQHLRVASMPHVTIELWSRDRSDDFYAEMGKRLGQVYPGAGGYTPGNKDICLLWDPTTPRAAVHEYAHLVSIAVKSNIGNNPRWLWEAVAQYESRTFDQPASWPPAQRAFPGFAQLNQYNSSLPYRWGYFICSTVIARWGDDAYLNLIKSNADIRTTLGITEEELGNLVESVVRNLAGS
jgi:hypothetical protein